MYGSRDVCTFPEIELRSSRRNTCQTLSMRIGVDNRKSIVGRLEFTINIRGYYFFINIRG